MTGSVGIPFLYIFVQIFKPLYTFMSSYVNMYDNDGIFCALFGKFYYKCLV
jgi:hypothetical protein